MCHLNSDTPILLTSLGNCLSLQKWNVRIPLTNAPVAQSAFFPPFEVSQITALTMAMFAELFVYFEYGSRRVGGQCISCLGRRQLIVFSLGILGNVCGRKGCTEIAEG
jgi:hypothetical protein